MAGAKKKRKTHSWSRKRSKPARKPVPVEQRRTWLMTKGDRLRCFCARCRALDRGKWGYQGFQLAMFAMWGEDPVS